MYVLQTGHDHFISNNIGLSCYCAKPKLGMIGAATSKMATCAFNTRAVA